MPLLFNRSVHSTDPLCVGVDSLAMSPDPAQAALGVNLAHDERVSDERTASFRATVSRIKKPPRGQNVVEFAVEEHHRDHVRMAKTPEFVSRRLNQINIRNDDLQHPCAELCTVLDLSGLQRLYAWDQSTLRNDQGRERRPHFAIGPDRNEIQGSTQQWDSWLDGHLNTGLPEQKRFVASVLMLMIEYAVAADWQVEQPRAMRHNVWWATDWPWFARDVLGDGPDRWAEAIGTHRKSNRWLAVLKYEFADTGRAVYRPTQLDAGRYPLHFPTPSNSLAGHPMDIGDATNYPALPREFIHLPLASLGEANVVAVEKTTRESAAFDLAEARRRHRERLAANYPGLNGAWMPK